MTERAPRGTVPPGTRGMFRRIQLSAFVIAAVAMLAPKTHAASWLEKNFWMEGPEYSGKLPHCDYPPALSKIQYNFGIKEDRFWNSRLRIAAFQNLREIAFRPWAPDTIPRRYCAGLALVNDGSERPIYYSIGEDFDLIGATWGVEWCVVGLDRNWAFNPACKVAKP